MRFRGQNPVYKYGNFENTYDDSTSATYGGVVTKTAVLLGIIAITAMYFASTLSFFKIVFRLSLSGSMKLGSLSIKYSIASFSVFLIKNFPRIF